jgi:hypothetical protein
MVVSIPLTLRLPLRQAQGTLRTSGKEPLMLSPSLPVILSPSINSGQAPARSVEVEALKGQFLGNCDDNPATEG